MPSRLIVDRANRLTHNKKHFYSFEKYLTENEKESSAKDYRSVIIRMLVYFDEKNVEITTVGNVDINKYATTQKQGDGSVFRNAIRKFFSVVEAPGFHIDSFATQKNKDKSERKAKPLSIDEIIQVRNELSTKKEFKLLFAFEMFYTHGVTLGELEKFGNDNYSRIENTFMVNKTKKIVLSENIVSLIKKHPELLEQKGRTTYSTYMQDISNIIHFENRDKIVSKDLEKTRKELFPTCPRCRKKYPNSDEFWMLVQFKEDIYKKNWFYCRGCADAMTRGEE